MAHKLADQISLTKHHVYASSQLHLLIPVSSSNKYFCQLLLSSVLLNYPPPVLVNWGTTETDDVFAQHVGRIDAVKSYLDKFPPGQEDDLVLIIDGYDVWFQLPPDVIIRRYYAIREVQNKRLISRFGSGTVRRHDLRQTIIFGADKLCWPEDEGKRVACWAAPPSTMPLYSYGPYNDTDVAAARKDPYHSRPRWLNPGSVIGPARDLRALFQATSDMVHNEGHAESDQWHYAKMFGIQEYARTLLEAHPSLPPEDAASPVIQPGQQTEFHIGLDYENAMFQSVGYDDPYLTWWQHDGSLDAARPNHGSIKSIHDFKMDDDVRTARHPFAAMSRLSQTAFNEKYQEILRNAGGPRLKVWSHLPMATNVITRHIFAMMHFTFEKDYRETWWRKMWFHPYARDLYRVSSVENKDPVYEKKIDGKQWFNALEPVVEHAASANQGRRDGAWTDTGEWKPFSALCDVHDEFLFGTSYENTVLSIPDP